MAGPIRIAILANGSQARRELTQVEGSLGRLQASATKAAKLGVGALALGAGALAKSAIDAEKQFSTSMRLIQANTKATSAEMDKLNKLAIQLGADTSFSAGEAADAMLELAKAGLDTKTIMGGGLAGTLQLAAAGGTDLATASTIASNALNTFHLAGKDMASIAAALAGGANASTASVESLGIALSQVGPGALNAGMSLQETVAALAAFDSAGIKGSDAGTSLKTMLARLVPSTERAADEMAMLGINFVKSNGEFQSMTQIAEQLKNKLGPLTDAQRTQSLATIFGSDATRAATVLLNEGADGLRKYIRATKDQDAAQEAAAARMGGTAGALERLSGSIETAKLRLGQELAPAVTKGADALGDKLVPAMDRAIDAGHDIAGALAPAAREISEALGHLADQGDEAGAVFDNVLVPALEATSEVVGGLVDFVDDLPGPVKEIGVQAGIAALVFPRMAAGVTTATGAMTLQIAKLQQLRAELTYTATRAQLTDSVAAKLGGTMRTVAGVGGMAALTLGAKDSNEAVRALAQAAGGAAVGFSVGGPVGAAVGGLAGLMTGLADGTHSAEIAALNSITTWATYRDTLDDVSGVTTKATKAMVIQELQQNGLLSKATALGISQRTLVNGVLGQVGARSKLAAAIQAEEDSIRAAGEEYKRLGFNSAAARAQTDEDEKLLKSIKNRWANIDALKAEIGELDKANQLKAEEIAITNNLPPTVVTEIQALGAKVAATDIARLSVLYGLTPKQIRSTIKVSGKEIAYADVKGIKAQLVGVGNVKPSSKWQNDLRAGLGGGKQDVTRGKADLNRLLTGIGDVNAKVKKGKLGKSLKSDIDQMKTDSARGGVDVGNGLGAGLWGTMQAWIEPIRAKGYAMGKAGVDGAKAGAATQSPSRETIWVGRMVGEGLAVGMDATTPIVGRGGVKLGKAATDGVLAGVAGGSASVDAALERLTKQIERAIKPGKGKNAQKREEKREKQVLKGLKDEYAALRANGAAIDAINEKLEQQRQAVEDAKKAYDDYAASIKSTITATGDITQLGRQEDGTVSLTSLLNELENAANDADRFADLSEKLAGLGLKQTAIDQILAAGPAAALATLEAIDTGGQGAVDKINELQGRLDATGAQLGAQMAGRFYQSGIDAAQGLVNGTLSELGTAEAAGEALGAALLKGVKKKLKIKSPSRAFVAVGDDVMRGLDIGIDDTVASRAGARAALSLTEGFGDPALSATATWSAMSKAERLRTVRIRLSAEQVSQLQRGREIQADLDYARSNGVTGTTF